MIMVLENRGRKLNDKSSFCFLATPLASSPRVALQQNQVCDLFFDPDILLHTPNFLSQNDREYKNHLTK